MKIVIFVDYSSKEFNSDFKLSNMLINKGHSVFLAINDNQFYELKEKCDKSYLGLSMASNNDKYPNEDILDNKDNI